MFWFVFNELIIWEQIHEEVKHLEDFLTVK